MADPITTDAPGGPALVAATYSKTWKDHDSSDARPFGGPPS